MQTIKVCKHQIEEGLPQHNVYVHIWERNGTSPMGRLPVPAPGRNLGQVPTTDQIACMQSSVTDEVASHMVWLSVLLIAAPVRLPSVHSYL